MVNMALFATGNGYRSCFMSLGNSSSIFLPIFSVLSMNPYKNYNKIKKQLHHNYEIIKMCLIQTCAYGNRKGGAGMGNLAKLRIA